MYESLKSTLNSWNATTTERSKLQHFYITLALLLLIIAGIIGLVNQDLGQQILAVAIAAAGVFLVNAVAWALLQSFILFRLGRQVTNSTVAVTAKPTRKTTNRKK